MKNIYVLPTNKLTNLYIFEGKLEFSNSPQLVNCQNIYITSDEEIKNGEYGICLNLVREGFKSHQAVFKMDAEQRQAMEDLGGQKKAEVLKVILSTDQDLIGVQAIDDDFLEWFIKNPSCEEVEIDKKENLWFCCDFFEEGQENYCINSMPRCPKCNSALGGNPEFTNYKIITPKGKPKQDLEKDMFELEQELDIPSHLRWHNSKPKQETLEEVAERLYPISNPDNVILVSSQTLLRNVLIRGAKWQAERMYSKEDLEVAYFEGKEGLYSFNYWLRQFKKK